jgi:carbon monoxide dehydrogenase subunit G
MRYQTSVEIERPIEDVWAFMLDPFNMPRWNLSWLGIRQTSPAPLGLGSTLQARMAIFGFEVPASGEIVEWDPPRAVSLSVRIGRIGSGFVHARLEATGAGTRLVRGADLEIRPLLRPLFWVAGRALRRRSASFDERFKRRLEAESPAQVPD